MATTTTPTSPSISGSSLQYWGLGSDMSNIPEIIDALIGMDKVKITSYEYKQDILNEQKSAWNNLKIGVNNIIDDISKAEKSGLSVRKISYSDSNYFTATSNTESASMDYSVSVSKLAKSQVVASNKSSDINKSLNLSGSFSINGAKIDVVETDSLSSIRNKIAQAKDDTGTAIGARSYIIDGTMFIDNVKTGASSSLNLEDADGILSSIGILNEKGKLNVSQESQNAEFYVNNQKIVRESNTVSDAVTGLTFNLTKETTSAITMTVGSDKDSLKNYVKNLVTAINDLVTLSDSYTSYNTESGMSGILNGDTSVPTLKNAVMKDFFGKFSGGTPSYLFEIGVSVDKYGKVNIDDTKLNNAINTNYDGVVRMLTSNIDSTSSETDDGTGIFVKIKNNTKKLLDDKDGVFKTRTDFFTKQVKTLDDMITKQNSFIASKTASLTTQFAAMEKALSLAKRQQQYLDSQFNNKNSN